MEYRNLGNSGLKVSVVGLGCNNFGMRIDAEQTRVVVGKALDEGINLFDTADIYGDRGGSETMLGKALGPRRHEIIVASKFGMAMGDGPYHEGRVAPLHHGGGRGEPEAPEHGLHGSLPDPFARSAKRRRRKHSAR